jgi:hypothetical protein
MLMDRAGMLAPACASRPLVFTNLGQGQVMGMFWAWGADGRVYFLQGSGAAFQLRRFMPNFKGVPIVVENVGATIASCPRVPAWAVFSHNVYLSIYSVGTYEINTTGPSLTKMTTAGIGDVPGGRTIVGFGERFMVAGIADARLGTQGNRVTFSEPADSDNFPDLNYFDVGNDDYIDFWTNKWADLLMVNRKYLGVEGATALRSWIRGEVAANTPSSSRVHHERVSTRTSRGCGCSTIRAAARPVSARRSRVPSSGMLTVLRTRSRTPPTASWSVTAAPTTSSSTGSRCRAHPARAAKANRTNW